MTSKKKRHNVKIVSFEKVGQKRRIKERKAEMFQQEKEVQKKDELKWLRKIIAKK